MRIEGKRILALDHYLKHIAEGTSIRVLFEIKPDDREAVLSRAGFVSDATSGDTVLPLRRGPVSTFNAEGHDIVRKDLPKEPRYIRTVFWRWREWAGRNRTVEREDYRDLYRDCFPRDHVAAPGSELTLVRNGDGEFIISETLVHEAAQESKIKHIVNLFLELFGGCEVVGASLERFTPARIRKANWRLLPPGEYPWSRLKGHIAQAIARTSDDSQRVIWNRQETLQAHNPDEIFVGQGGFNDYLAYVFRGRGLVVLESIRRDNAIYVFGADWQRVSQLSKAEILRSHLQIDRVIHSKGWKARLRNLLTGPIAA